MKASPEWYRVFLHAAETGNLTHAAQRLHMTQPSVSYAIKQLEKTLGVKLFDRLSRGVRLTQEGEAMYEHVRQAFEQLDSAERMIKKLQQFSEGHLRIGANGAIIKDFLLPSLDAFHVRYPDIQIQLSQERTSRILERLRHGALDIGYVYVPIADDEIEVISTVASPYCVVVGRSYEDWAHRESLSTKQLLEIPLLMLSPGSTTSSFIKDWFQSQGLEADADFELSSLDMLAEFTERGYGAAILPRAFVASRVDSGKLLELPLDVPLPDRSVGVAVRKETVLSLAAKAFLDMLPQEQ